MSVESLEQASGGEPGRRTRTWSGPVLVALCFAVATWLSWRRWPDIGIDYGVQLYQPWQLAEGRVLHRDVATMHGPLSAHVHALLFALFGPGMLVLAIFNLLLTALATWLVLQIVRVLSNRLVAAVAGLMFVFVFAFSVFLGVSNYNFVTPYTHEITHGAVLSLAAIWLFHRYDATGRRWRLLASGALFGLVLMTKAEVAAALGLALTAGFVAAAWTGAWTSARTGRASLRPVLIDAALFGALALAAVGVVFLLLVPRGGPFWALQSITLPWRFVLAGSAPELLFFKTTMGTLDLSGNLVRMAWATLGVLVLSGIGLCGLAIRRAPRRRRLWESVALVVAAAGLMALPVPVLEFAAALPLVVLVALAIAAARLKRQRPGLPGAEAKLLAVVLFAFAFALLLKVLFNVGVWHYGFVLALPATLACLILLGSWLPAWVDRRGGWGGLTRAVALASALVVAGHSIAGSHALRAGRVHPIGEGLDRFYLGQRVSFDARVLDLIRERVQPWETLAMMPEGVMFNYLARRANSTPYISLMPAEWSTFGKAAILEALDAAPPDFVGLVHMDTSSYGPRFFGTDYGAEVMEWLMANYEVRDRVGRPPLSPGRGEFGFALLGRRSLGTGRE